MSKKLLWLVAAAIGAGVIALASGCNPQCVDRFDCRSLGPTYICNDSNQCVVGAAACPDGGVPGADGGC